MFWVRFGRAAFMTAVALVASAGLVVAGQLGSAAQVRGGHSGAGDCIAHHPNSDAQYPIWYAAGCSGHDEPELDPVSSLAGSAQDLTWTAVLPSDGTVSVSAVGPTFWWGGTVTDPNPQALFGQAFLEVQFYPDAIVNNCSSAGGFNVTYAPDKFSVCTPVWQVGAKSNAETAAFNAELYDGSSSQPLVMNAGDTIRLHFFVASAAEGWHVQVTDLTTGHSGTVVLNSKYGPMLPPSASRRSATPSAGDSWTTPRTLSSGKSGTPRSSAPRPGSTACPARPAATPTTPRTGWASAR